MEIVWQQPHYRTIGFGSCYRDWFLKKKIITADMNIKTIYAFF